MDSGPKSISEFVNLVTGLGLVIGITRFRGPSHVAEERDDASLKLVDTAAGVLTMDVRN